MSENAFREVRLKNPVVQHILRRGGSLEECVVALHEQTQKLTRRVMELESIAPKKLRGADGTIWIHHAPDSLVPISE